ncbi:hypothetical protein PF004_g28685 [Phytophthora fragariae]|uniref:Uncharacterized protein n=1 Tax=Phytophthora fragariae TaxID=53985 RepID=A0A6G0MGZ4_9STRA|nr:hypothetical protein PF003_g24018 [Phytophthora fragariae]KAE8911572.1 hypothetical protein PF003_g4116 [Phytophthora fragariae]KAE8911573.1 hypothetical protein PF003_g4117 [Phytophthora fragariae]KAE9167856.1 hypothetical protein PF004_g28685 [Phytophthora fragariae]
MKVAVQRQRCVHKRAESHQDEAAVRPSASAVKGKLPSRGGEDYCGAAEEATGGERIEMQHQEVDAVQRIEMQQQTEVSTAQPSSPPGIVR